jgi:nucleotide-binding universal stress UspA family protein
MARTCRLVQRRTLRQQARRLSAVSLDRRDVLQAAVAVLFVVPAHEPMHPVARLLQGYRTADQATADSTWPYGTALRRRRCHCSRVGGCVKTVGTQTLSSIAARRFEAEDVRCACRLVKRPVSPSRISDTIVDEACSWSADLIVMGTHGRRGHRKPQDKGGFMSGMRAAAMTASAFTSRLWSNWGPRVPNRWECSERPCIWGRTINDVRHARARGL